MNFIPKRALKIKNGWAQCLSKDRQKIVSYHFTTFMMFKDVLLHTFYLVKKSWKCTLHYSNLKRALVLKVLIWVIELVKLT